VRVEGRFVVYKRGGQVVHIMSGSSAPAADFVVNKGGPKRSFPFRGDETLEVMPLGGGNEVGRSCCLLKFKGKTIMFDCGVHPGYRGEESLPFFDEVDADQVDLLLVTHFHVDHAAGVPYWLTKTAFKGKTYMTYPTLAICKLVWSDFIKVSGVADGSGNLYNDKDIQDTISQINLIDYHQEIEVEGVRFSCFNAGHVLGACMYLVQIAGVRVLYTGDYSRQEDRHLMAAEMPGVKVNVLVVESTYGVQVRFRLLGDLAVQISQHSMDTLAYGAAEARVESNVLVVVVVVVIVIVIVMVIVMV